MNSRGRRLRGGYWVVAAIVCLWLNLQASTLEAYERLILIFAPALGFLIVYEYLFGKSIILGADVVPADASKFRRGVAGACGLGMVLVCIYVVVVEG